MIGWLDAMDDFMEHDRDQEEHWDEDWFGMRQLMVDGVKVSIGHPNITNAELRDMQDGELEDRFYRLPCFVEQINY